MLEISGNSSQSLDLNHDSRIKVLEVEYFG